MSQQDSATAVVEPIKEKRQRDRKPPKRQPRYQVILWDDDDHTYEYVMQMMQELFAHSKEKAFKVAEEVDTTGRAICLTTTKEHAELKRDQIHAYGRDIFLERCTGSMWASIEPVPE